MTDELEGHFTITVPAKPLERDYTGDRSALYILSDNLVDAGFTRSATNPNVMTTRNLDTILDIVASKRRIGSRKDVENHIGLENDPSRQQMIVYTFLTAGDSILMYRRASKADTRLAGAASIGFGGHTTYDDLADIAILEEREEGKFMETRREDGSLWLGINREFEEELGISRKDIELQAVGAFHETFTDDDFANKDRIPVGAVHTCIIATAILSPDVKQVHLQKEEIAEAYWVKISDLPEKIHALKKEGVTVENWTDIGVSEFEDILENQSGEPQLLPDIVID